MSLPPPRIVGSARVKAWRHARLIDQESDAYVALIEAGLEALERKEQTEPKTPAAMTLRQARSCCSQDSGGGRSAWASLCGSSGSNVTSGPRLIGQRAIVPDLRPASALLLGRELAVLTAVALRRVLRLERLGAVCA
jgi:hypothetical protein